LIRGNGLVAQSGGPTAVINNSVCGILHQWHQYSAAGNLYGALFGISGILKENLANLSVLNEKDVLRMRYSPGAALGSSRYKIKDEGDIRKLLEQFKKIKINHFFYIGGNDSMDSANTISQYAKSHGYDLTVNGVPKTIDNDLLHTDHCPGYGSAAKYIATTVLETGIDLKSIISKNRVLVLEVMGRNTGWLAAAAALAKKNDSDPPHLIYLPEVPFDKNSFIQDVDTVYKKFGIAYIVASEGLVDREGKYVCCETSQDSFGHRQLGGVGNLLKNYVQDALGIQARCNVLGTTQRSAMHLVSKTDVDEAYRVGIEAVRLAHQDASGLMTTLIREKQDYYCAVGNVKLSEVANGEKMFPLAWINHDGNYITNKYYEYASPLIRGTLTVPTKNGLPDYCCLKEIQENKQLRIL
jgi:6-phosphofructokinase 1